MQEPFVTAPGAGQGESDSQSDEVLRYNHNPFDLAVLDSVTLPLEDEPCVSIWQEWRTLAGEGPVWPILRAALPQLAFPIAAGMSQTEDYRAATLSGRPVAGLASATGLELAAPDDLELLLHRTAAGAIPVLVARRREDFVALVQALGRRNEARVVPPAMGAQMVAGFNNWARIRRHREAWEATPEDEREAATWREEFRRLRTDKELFQDRFMILSDGPYSAVPAADLDLDDATWRDFSLTIRREHEATHYFTRRLFGVMRNNLLDELIADYSGIVAAAGRYRADWFLRFIGVEADGSLRDDGRIHLYRGDPPLSDGALAVLGRLVARAATQLEAFDATVFAVGEARSLRQQATMIVTLASLRLEEMGTEDGAEALSRAFAAADERLRWRTP